MKKLINLIDNLSGIGGWVAGILMAVALVISVGEIIFRSFLHSTLYIADEYTGYLMAMLTFMGLGYTLRERGPKWDKDMEAISNKNGIETVAPSKQMLQDLEKVTQNIRAEWLKTAPPEGKKIYADFLKKVGR
jgi:hypothetical protein